MRPNCSAAATAEAPRSSTVTRPLRAQGEGPALFRVGGTAYMLMSDLTGWNPNPAKLVATASPRLCGAAWHLEPNPATGPGGNTTYDSQSTFVLPLTLGDGSTFFIYMGDRWNFMGPGSVRAPGPYLTLSLSRMLRHK